MKISNHAIIYISKSKISKAGLGVFADRKIQKGKVIEICPVIKLSKDDIQLLSANILATYTFFAGKEKNTPLLALGYGSLYNHSHAPNAFYKINLKQKTISFFALRIINRNEEITVNYKQDAPKISAPLWFE